MYAVKQNKEQNVRCETKQGTECMLRSKTRKRMHAVKQNKEQNVRCKAKQGTECTL
jgi:hypothetical protein